MIIESMEDIKEGTILVNGGTKFKVDRIAYVLGTNRTEIREFLLWSYKKGDYIHPVSKDHMQYFVERGYVEYASVKYTELAAFMYPNGHREGDRWVLK